MCRNSWILRSSSFPKGIQFPKIDPPLTHKDQKGTEIDRTFRNFDRHLEGPNPRFCFVYRRYVDHLETEKNTVKITHNPKVVGSNPTPAPKAKSLILILAVGCKIPKSVLLSSGHFRAHLFFTGAIPSKYRLRQF